MTKKKENPVKVGYIFSFVLRFVRGLFILFSHVFSLGKFHYSGTERSYFNFIYIFLG